MATETMDQQQSSRRQVASTTPSPLSEFRAGDRQTKHNKIGKERSKFWLVPRL